MRDEKGETQSIKVKQESPEKERKRQDLKKRLKEYALRIIRLYESLPKHGAVHRITHQLLRSGTSPGAQYREACRAKSNADFVSKIEGALQELDESDYWLELLIDGDFVAKKNFNPCVMKRRS